nr:hypothetical protein [Tanacetum cinerariifolium]
NIEYVEASPHNSELVSLEAIEIVISEVEEIKDDNLRKKLLNVHLLIANIEALKDNPTPSSKLLTKSSSISAKSFLEETNTFHNSLPKFENFCFDLEEISSGSTTIHSDISLLDYEAFYFDDDHIEEISSGSTTTHSYVSLSKYTRANHLSFQISDDEGANKEDGANELYRDVNINLEGRDIQMEDVQTTQVIEDTHVTLTLVNPEGQQQSLSVSSRFVSNILNPSLDTCIDSIFNLNTESTPRVDVLVTTTSELPLLSATTLPPPSTPIIPTLQQTPAISSIPDTVDKYLDHRMNEAVKVAVQLQSDRLGDEAQAKNEDFLNKLDENIQKIIKEQVKEQVKVQVSKILPNIKKNVNEKLEAEVLTRSSNSSKTSYAVATNLSELELKK